MPAGRTSAGAEGALRLMADGQERKLRLLVDGAEKGLLARHLDDYVAAKRYQGQAEAYIHNCRRQVELIAEAHGWTRPEDFEADAILEHLARRRASGELEPTTANHIRAYGHTFFRWLIKQGRFTRDNPFARVPKAPVYDDETVGAFTREELDRIRAATRANKRSKDRALGWDFLADTGMRVGAASRMTVNMLDLDHAEGPRINLPARLEKNRHARTVLLTRSMAEALRENVKGKAPADRVFSAVLKWDAFERDRKRAGVPKCDPQGKKRGRHALRHTFESNVSAAAPVSDRQLAALMGHRTVGKMQAIYADRRLLRLSDVMSQVPGVLDASGAGDDADERPPLAAQASNPLTPISPNAMAPAGAGAISVYGVVHPRLP